MSKKCTKCQIDQPEQHYFKDRSRKDGLFARCKTCINAHRKSTLLKHTCELDYTNINITTQPLYCNKQMQDIIEQVVRATREIKSTGVTNELIRQANNNNFTYWWSFISTEKERKQTALTYPDVFFNTRITLGRRHLRYKQHQENIRYVTIRPSHLFKVPIKIVIDGQKIKATKVQTYK